MAKRKIEYEEDDGSVVSPMNVDGMPWYVKNKPELGAAPSSEKLELSKEGQRAFLGGVLKAALLVAGVFVLVFFLFILFCDTVWFR